MNHELYPEELTLSDIKNSIVTPIKYSINLIFNLFGFYILWILLHFASSHMYSYHCTHLSLSGLFFSPLVVSTPQCIALRWMISEGSNTIVTMWFVSGSYILKKITNRNYYIQ